MNSWGFYTLGKEETPTPIATPKGSNMRNVGETCGEKIIDESYDPNGVEQKRRGWFDPLRVVGDYEGASFPGV